MQGVSACNFQSLLLLTSAPVFQLLSRNSLDHAIRPGIIWRFSLTSGNVLCNMYLSPRNDPCLHATWVRASVLRNRGSLESGGSYVELMFFLLSPVICKHACHCFSLCMPSLLENVSKFFESVATKQETNPCAILNAIFLRVGTLIQTVGSPSVIATARCRKWPRILPEAAACLNSGRISTHPARVCRL